MLKIKLQKVTEDARMPYKASSEAACYDVYAHSITIKEEGKVIVGLGFKTELPKGYRGVIVPRSNLTKSFWMLNNSIGIVDADYRGEWMAIYTQIPVPMGTHWGTTNFPYNVGDRVAQIYFEEVIDTLLIEDDNLSDTARGSGGFGSTGLK